MGKYKATISCDRKVWEEFKVYCTKLGSNSSLELEKFMKVMLSNDLQKAKKLEVYDLIESLTEKFIAENLGLMLPPIQFSELNQFIDKYIDKYLGEKLADYLNNNPTAIENSANTGGTDNTASTADTASTDNTDNTDPRINELLDQREYSDMDVAKIEGISQASIFRYRQGQRNPRDKTFFKRWKYQSNVRKWTKLNNQNPN